MGDYEHGKLYVYDATSQTFDPVVDTHAQRALDEPDRISFPRGWLEGVSAQMHAMELPSGKLGDWLFLFRAIIKDALDEPVTSVVELIKRAR